jgi:hypothetical protein
MMSGSGGVDGTGEGGSDAEMDMGLLSQRIAKLRSGEGEDLAPTIMPILVLDSMLPRQKITISMDDDAGMRLVNDSVTHYGGRLGVHGADPVSKQVSPLGTQVLIVERSGSYVALVGQRRYVLSARPQLHEQTYYTSEVAFFARDEGCNDDVIAAEELGPLVERWQQLVRTGGCEREPGQLDCILADLGPMPPAADPEERALYIAALINPLPALGVAFEIRPAVLAARSAGERLRIVRTGIERSIGHLDGSKPLW